MPAKWVRELRCLISIVALAGCGASNSSAGSTSASPSQAQTGSPTQALYQKAQTEGQVVWYSPEADDKIASVIQAFEKAYPGVKIAHTQKPAQQQLPDIEVQQSAHHVTIDVGQVTQGNVNEAVANHIFMTADWAAL